MLNKDSTSNNESMLLQTLLLLEPNGGVHRSVKLNSSGNFTYSLGGGSNAWKYTRRF